MKRLKQVEEAVKEQAIERFCQRNTAKTVPALVTGAAGFMGSHLCKLLDLEDVKTIAVVRDIVPNQWIEDCLGNCIKAHGDVRDQSFIQRLIVRYDIAQIYHLAAQPLVGRALRDPGSTYDNNIQSTVSVLEAARTLDVPAVLIMSTDKVYGPQEDATEQSPYIPTDPYSTSKIACDAIARSYIHSYGMRIVIPRPCNGYGYDLERRIVPNTIRACLKGERPIIYEGELTKRQYIYMEDLVSILKYLCDHTDPEGPEESFKGPVNVVGPGCMSQAEVVYKIAHFFKVEPQFVKRTVPPEIEKQSMIPQPSHPDLIKYTFEAGVAETIQRFRTYGV